jgi:tetrathionate reductase subunit B
MFGPDRKMGRKAFIIDVNACVGCHNCFIACKDEFVDHAWYPYSEAQPDMGPSWITVREIERGQFPKVKTCYIPQLCMHCENPPCVRAAKDGAVYQREDGIVIIDPHKSRGQRHIVKACPYGSIEWNEKLDIPQKCTFCIHLLDQGWKEPRCVEVCPTQALRFGEREAFAAEVVAQTGQLLPEYGSKTSVYYLGVPKAFIAGTIYCSNSGECLEGARASLMKESGEKILSATTNNYGDFEFEGVEVGSTYSVKIEADGYYSITIGGIYTKKDVVLKDIYLQKRVWEPIS